MKYHDAKNLARDLSTDNKCVQYVNRRIGMTYYVSDWFNCDSTVVIYENGRLHYQSDDDITQALEDAMRAQENATLVLNSDSDTVEFCTRHPEDAPHTHIRRVWSDDSDSIRERLYTD